MTLKCIEVLTAEHKTMLRITDVLDSMSKQARDRADCDTADVEAIVDILRRFGDGLHQAKEEGALFPVFTTVCDASEYAAVRHMLFEHEQDRALMSGMQDSISRSNAPQFAEYASRLATVLRNHIFKEDNILFETINDHLSAEDDARVLAEFESFDQGFYPQRAHLKDELRRLEWKYLRKIA
jgi:hemerythrin-like domain-containing protein